MTVCHNVIAGQGVLKASDQTKPSQFPGEKANTNWLSDLLKVAS